MPTKCNSCNQPNKLLINYGTAMLTSERAKLCVSHLLKLLQQTYRQIRYPAGNCITSMELRLALTVDASALAATHSFLQATNTFRVDSERGRRCTPAQLSIHIV